MSSRSRAIPGERSYLDIQGVVDWPIVIASSAIPSERFAAEEFRRLFEEATGLALRVSGCPGDDHQVHIGHASLPHGDPLADLEGLGDEGFRIKVGGDRIVIAGGVPRGTLYGVYQFFEDFMGVRFLTHDHAHFPGKPPDKIPCGSNTRVPPFSFRWSFYRENAEYPEFATRLRQNTITDEDYLGGRTPQDLINHSLHMLVPFSEYGEEHPEYYALVDGKRDTSTAGGGPQLCVTNPEVIEVAARSAILYLDQHPETTNISVSQADTANFCRCESCEAINQREGTPMGAQLAFVNAIAERVEGTHPDVKVGTLAYWYSRRAPRTIRPRHNVQIQLCTNQCCTLHPIDDPDCEKNSEFRRDMADWGRICDDIIIWNYNTNFNTYDLPFPNLRVIGPNLRYFLKNNVSGVFMQANGSGLSGELSDLRNYLICRLLWDPALDDRLLLEEFIRLHYAEAAKPILDYVNMLHDNAKSRVPHIDIFPKPEEVGLDLEISRRAMGFFESALALANSDAVRARIEKASICAYKAMIMTGDNLPDEERSELVERYITLGRRYDMKYEAEWRPSEDYFRELGK